MKGTNKLWRILLSCFELLLSQGDHRDSKFKEIKHGKISIKQYSRKSNEDIRWHNDKLLIDLSAYSVLISSNMIHSDPMTRLIQHQTYGC